MIYLQQVAEFRATAAHALTYRPLPGGSMTDLAVRRAGCRRLAFMTRSDQ
jgi:hypothetical protein